MSKSQHVWLVASAILGFSDPETTQQQQWTINISKHFLCAWPSLHSLPLPIPWALSTVILAFDRWNYGKRRFRKVSVSLPEDTVLSCAADTRLPRTSCQQRVATPCSPTSIGVEGTQQPQVTKLRSSIGKNIHAQEESSQILSEIESH